MRLLHVTLAGALVAVALAIIGSKPVNAAEHCPCAHQVPSSGICTQYGICEQLPEGAGTFESFRNTRACRRTQALLCEYRSCKVVCGPRKT
jgi:hypothetical protein